MGEGRRGGEGRDGGERGGGKEGTRGGRNWHLWRLESACLGPREGRGSLLKFRYTSFNPQESVNERLEGYQYR